MSGGMHMYQQRGQYLSIGHTGCLVSVITRFDEYRGGINSDALLEGLVRVQMLHTLKVLYWRLAGKENHRLVLYLFIPNKILNDAEVAKRIDKYMEAYRQKKQRFWHRPRYNGKELCNVSTFMHDLDWYVCSRTYSNAGKKGKRPRIDSRFICLELNPERLPLCIGEEAISGIYKGLAELMPEVKVGISQDFVCDGFSFGEKEFVERNRSTNRKREKRYDDAITDMAELQEMLDEWQAEHNMKVREATQCLLTDLLDEATTQNIPLTSYNTNRDILNLMNSGIITILLFANKWIKYLLYRRMLARERREQQQKELEENTAACSNL